MFKDYFKTWVTMFPFIRIHIVIFASLHFVHTHTSRSSFFKISLQKDLHTEKDVFITKSVRDGFHCALTCNTNTECHFAVFDKDLKKCSLLKENAKLNHQITHGSETESERKLFLEKVRFCSLIYHARNVVNISAKSNLRSKWKVFVHK